MRTAFCTGCCQTFPKMHLLFIHRGQDRCGGRFCPPNEIYINALLHMIGKRRIVDPTMRECVNDLRIDRARARHDRIQSKYGARGDVLISRPKVRLPSAPRLTNAEAAAERKRVNRIRIGAEHAQYTRWCQQNPPDF